MAGTFSQIYIQIVFAVKGRKNLIQPEWKSSLFKYISGIIENKGHKSIIVNGVSDNVNIFVGMKPAMAISDLVRDIKNNSSNFINDQKFTKKKFPWQEGYGAFSYAHSQVGAVYNYILNQEQHHRKVSFKDEYHEFLKNFTSNMMKNTSSIGSNNITLRGLNPPIPLQCLEYCHPFGINTFSPYFCIKNRFQEHGGNG